LMVQRNHAAWPIRVAIFAPLLTLDIAFWCANVGKFASGGWISLAIATVVSLLMYTWVDGRRLLSQRVEHEVLPESMFLKDLERNPDKRVPGTAVFLARTAVGIPRTFLHNLKHNKVVHEQVVLLSIINEEVPVVAPEERLETTALGLGFFRIFAHFGFSEDPNIPELLAQVNRPGLNLGLMRTTFFLGRESLVVSDRPGMALWRKHLFAMMSRNAFDASKYFEIPPNRVIELGIQVEL